jgi:hypothetical protein
MDGWVYAAETSSIVSFNPSRVRTEGHSDAFRHWHTSSIHHLMI